MKHRLGCLNPRFVTLIIMIGDLTHKKPICCPKIANYNGINFRFSCKFRDFIVFKLLNSITPATVYKV